MLTRRTGPRPRRRRWRPRTRSWSPTPYAQAKLDSDYAASLAQLPDGKGKRRGVAFGTRVAENLIRLRDGDGRNAPILFT
jgi:hypothetical protein